MLRGDDGVVVEDQQAVTAAHAVLRRETMIVRLTVAKRKLTGREPRDFDFENDVDLTDASSASEQLEQWSISKQLESPTLYRINHMEDICLCTGSAET